MAASATPLVSVLLTVYERTDYVEQALAAVEDQTLRDFEVVVADDSRIDVLRDLCEVWARRFEPAGVPFRRVRTEGGEGVVRNLARAAAVARGRYIAVLNDDDWWEPDFLARLAGALEADPRRVLAFSDHWVVDEEGRRLDDVSHQASRDYGRAALPPGDAADPVALALRETIPLAMASLVRRDALDLGAVPLEVRGAYDYWIALQLALAGGAFAYVDDRLSHYRLHGEMETFRQAPDKADNLVFVYDTLKGHPGLAPFATEVRQRLADAHAAAGRARLLHDQAATARRHYGAALRARPSRRAALGWLATWAPFALRTRARLTLPPAAR